MYKLFLFDFVYCFRFDMNVAQSTVVYTDCSSTEGKEPRLW